MQSGHSQVREEMVVECQHQECCRREKEEGDKSLPENQKENNYASARRKDAEREQSKGMRNEHFER
jgi:hypothetical protein